jgi:hypothetical protein
MPLPTESRLRLFPGDDYTLFTAELTKHREWLQTINRTQKWRFNLA